MSGSVFVGVGTLAVLAAPVFGASGSAGLALANNGAVFTFDTVTQGGTDATGRAYVVLPSGTDTITDISPAQFLESGDVVGGVMKNPQRTTASVTDQGFDQRVSNYNASLNQTSAISVTAGDVVIKSVPHTATAWAAGHAIVDTWAAVHVVSAAPAANQVLGPSIGWAGKSTPEVYTIDMTALAARFQNFDATGMEFPPHSVLMDALQQFAPVFAMNTATNRADGYENFMAPGLKGSGSAGNGGRIEYGRDVAETIEVAALSLHYDAYTSGEKEQIALALIRHGIEWGFPLIGSGIQVAADGGHQQFWQFPTILALIATGRESEVATFMPDTGGGNWDGYFMLTEALIASELAPHDSTSKPPMARNRTLGAQPGGNVIRLPMLTGDRAQMHIPAGSEVIRNGDPVAKITTGFELASSGTYDATIDRQPATAFTSGDVITLRPPRGMHDAGTAQWMQRPAYGPSGITGNGEYWTPAKVNQYRDLQRQTGSVMALLGLGAFVPAFEAIKQYIEQTRAGNFPNVADAYDRPHGDFVGSDGGIYGAVADAYSANWSDFVALEQQGDVQPATAIAVSSVVVPGTVSPGVLTDGQVIGLVPGEDVANVWFMGTGGNDGVIQACIERESDATLVKDWFDLGTVASGNWSGVMSLPKADDWWQIKLRYRGAGAETTISAKWAVGYKFMLLGQSQMNGVMQGDTGQHTLTVASEGKHALYRSQPYGDGTNTIAESLIIVDAVNDASDGVRAMIDQFRAIDGATPVQWLSEAVNGTGVVDMLDDSDTSRQFSDLTAKTNKFGGDITAVIESWNTAPRGELATGDMKLDILLGIDDHGEPVDHSLHDALLPGFVYATMPATRASNQANDVDFSAEGITRANVLGLPVGYAMTDFQTQDETGSGGPHAEATGQGNRRFGARLALLAAKGIGETVPDSPYFPGTAERNSAGDVIRVDITAVNGGTFTSSAPTDLRCVSVSENGGSSYSTTGFTAALVLDDGTQYIDLTKDSGTWAAAGSLRVRPIANGPINDPHSDAVEADIVDGQVYETFADDVTGTGIPLAGTLDGGVWTLQGVTIETVTQESSGATGVSQATLLMMNNYVSPSAGTSERAMRSYYCYHDSGSVHDGANTNPGGTAPADGDEYVMAQALVSASLGTASGTDPWTIGIPNTVVEENDLTDIENTTKVAGSLAATTTDNKHQQAFWSDFAQGAGALANTFLTYLSHGSTTESMWSHAVFKLPATHTIAGAVTAADTDAAAATVTLDLSGVAGEWEIFAVAMDATDGSTITWTGATAETDDHVATFDGAQRRFEVAKSRGSGASYVVTATGATHLSVIACPPV